MENSKNILKGDTNFPIIFKRHTFKIEVSSEVNNTNFSWLVTRWLSWLWNAKNRELLALIFGDDAIFVIILIQPDALPAAAKTCLLLRTLSRFVLVLLHTNSGFNSPTKPPFDQCNTDRVHLFF